MECEVFAYLCSVFVYLYCCSSGCNSHLTWTTEWNGNPCFNESLGARMVDVRNVYRVLVRETERYRPFLRLKLMRENNIKANFKETWWKVYVFCTVHCDTIM